MLRIKGSLVHVASTEKLTHYGCHSSRGKKATDEIGILPTFTGTGVHDGFGLYGQYELLSTCSM